MNNCNLNEAKLDLLIFIYLSTFASHRIVYFILLTLSSIANNNRFSSISCQLLIIFFIFSDPLPLLFLFQLGVY